MKGESNWIGDFEIFLEQVETLQSLLAKQDLEAQELTQELSEANKEIQILHQELMASTKERLSFVEAFVVAKKMWRAEKPTSELLVQLLNALYRTEVTVEQLEGN